MRNEWARPRAVAAATLLLFVLALPAVAAEKKLGWSDVAEFGFVATAGNSETQTLGFKNTAKRTWEQSEFLLKAGAIRAESTKVLGVSEDTGDFVEETERTAENYYLNGKYRHDISPRVFWFSGGGWDRNRPAGINNRYVIEGGIGNIWFDRDDVKFRTDYGVTYTDQEDVFQPEAPEDRPDETFVGVRFSWDYLHEFGENTTYVNTLVIDENVEETSDYRADMVNSVSVAMSKRLALKVSLQWLYDNEPAKTSYDVLDVDGADTGRDREVELDDLDSILTVSLVVNF